MLKILFWLLLAINGVLFALGQGFSDRQAQRTEPQRLQRQLHPEQLILTPPAAPAASSAPDAPAPAAATPPAAVQNSQPTPIPASTPASAAVAVPVPPAPAPAAVASAAPPVSAPAAPEKLLACVDIGNFDPNEARAFRARLTAAKLHVTAAQRGVQEVGSYMVYIAAEDGREGAERRAAELRRLGMTDFYILPESAPLHDAISLGLFKTETAAKAYVGQLIAKGVRSARIVERNANSNKVAFRLRDLNAADQAGFATLVSAFPNQSRRDCSG
ncbi:SPOR domain-containing protein [Oxalobacteraceae bacterium CAVE-383]|nr:SPOR domain-containing protein [Oxalobacteraceae bacterium CAVE-383]